LITADLETRRGATKLTPFRWRLPIDAVAQRALRHFIALGKPKSPIASHGPHSSLALPVPAHSGSDHGRFSFLAARDPALVASFSHMYAPLLVVP
jgi:hypothetical protein